MKKIVKYDFACHACGFKVLNQKADGTFIKCNCEKFKFVDVTSEFYRYGCPDESLAYLVLYYDDGTVKKRELSNKD